MFRCEGWDTASCEVLALIDVTICVTPQQRLIGRALYSRLFCSITRNVSHRPGTKADTFRNHIRRWLLGWTAPNGIDVPE